MAHVFRDHPTVAGTRIWRQSPWRAVGSGITLILCLVLIIGVLAAAGFGVVSPHAFDDMGTAIAAGVCILLFVAVMGAMAQLVWRDMRGKFGGSITLSDSEIVLHLPAGRSLIHNPPRCEMTIALSDVMGIDARSEVYGAQGMAMMNRVYRLRISSGDPVFLFEQRGLGSNVETASMQEIADEMATRIGGRVRELGRFEGRGGLLGAWRAAPPGWTVAPLSAARWTVLQRRMAFTASIGVVIGALWVLRVLSGML